jgi:hypothetical protein
MKRDNIDFFLIADDQLAIHARLENWSLYVRDTRGAPKQGAIWKLGRSNGRQWHEPELKPLVDTLDGHVMEKAVSMLPELHREAIRWNYVFRNGPARIRRQLGVTGEGLLRLVVDARRMLINRSV